MRALAKQLAREMSGFSDVEKLLNNIDNRVFEEVFVAGLVIFYASFLSADEKILLTCEYLKKVDSWAQIDSFVQNLSKQKFAKIPSSGHPELDSGSNKEGATKGDGNTTWIPDQVRNDIVEIHEKYWQFALENLTSDQEFVVRHGVMILFENFLSQEKIADVFAKLREVKCDKYYAKMAMAWLYAEAAIEFYNSTLEEMKNAGIDAWTRRKGLTKMLESRRFSDAQKQEIRELLATIVTQNEGKK
jgi:hypothetical protein